MSSTSGIGGGGPSIYELNRDALDADAKADKAKDSGKTQDTQDTRAAEQAAGAAAARSTKATQGPQDVVETSPTKSEPGGVGGVSPGDGKAPIAMDADVSGTPSDNASTGAGVMNDVNMMFDAIGQSLDVAYAKTMRDTRNDIEGLKQMIEEISKSVDRLKEKADKLRDLAAKITELLPVFMNAINSDQDSPFCRNDPNQLTAQESQLVELLKKELAPFGIELKEGTLESLVNAIGEGGQAGMALAMSLLFTVAEMIVDGPEALALNPTAGSAAAELEDAQAEGVDTQPPVLEGEASVTVDAAPEGVVDPATGLVIEPELSEAQALGARLESLALYAQQYVDASPYDGRFVIGAWFGVHDFTSSQAQAGNALIGALFSDGTGVQTSDVAAKKNGDVIDIEGFKLDPLQITVASMMSPAQATAFIGGIIAEQLAGKLKEIDIAIKGLGMLQLALKDLIEVLEKSIVEAGQDKAKLVEELNKTKARVLKEVMRMVEEQAAQQAKTNEAMVNVLSNAVAGLFGTGAAILTGIADQPAQAVVLR